MAGDAVFLCCGHPIGEETGLGYLLLDVSKQRVKILETYGRLKTREGRVTAGKEPRALGTL